MKAAEGYILRIATKEWVDQIFDVAVYYTGFRRKWRPGQTIIFVHKTNVGDAVVGYGVIENVYERDELSEEERRECEKRGWKKALEFKYVLKFDKPLPIKETVLKDLKVHGRFLHGLSLNKQQLSSIIGQAERLQT
ncbi:hypothetical protein KAU93_04860 [Candidatus Bathyarchaeota archaeon]|nr:hypothetical protein [Candidatus Bathyarchaeota archaeon]